jgi:3-oxoacyl-[acyl-carrier protein] reductase
MIIVTGASSGIGRFIAQHLHESGERVLGISRSEFTSPYSREYADVSDYDKLKEIAKKLKSDGEPLYGLVNAAGIASMNLAVMTPGSTIKRIINTNLIGTINACAVFSPLMMRGKRGSIVNFSTIAVSLGLEGESVYVASKAGVESFTKVFAKEIAPHGLRANCVAPGPIETPLLSGVSLDQRRRIIDRQVMKRPFSVEDVSDLVSYLLSDSSSMISGETLHVGGA